MSASIIINADDFGLTESCSKAISEAFEKKLISSTTACANGEYIEEAYALALKNGFLDKVGIHINLTEGAPLTEEISHDPFFCESGKFHGRIARLKKPTKEQLNELKEELTAQIERLRRLGFSLSHADSHHHIHTCVYFENAIKDVLFSYGITKLRIHRNVGKIPVYKKIVKKWYNKKLRKQGFSVCRYFGRTEDFILKPKTLQRGTSEIMVHPDYNDQGILVNRVETADGNPSGKPLKEVEALVRGGKLISYEEVR